MKESKKRLDSLPTHQSDDDVVIVTAPSLDMDLFGVFEDESKEFSSGDLSTARLPPIPIPVTAVAAATIASLDGLDSLEKPKEVVLDEFQLNTDAATIERPSHFDSVNTRHEVVLPPDFDKKAYVPIKDHVPPSTWARNFPFKLDPFQEYAIYCVQRSESVLVAAHTSAGKTVVAEYAIAQALENKERVIYTSPIKALSNQKYRDLLNLFGDVGLMTGDVTISPNASCLVMTTEILRSMLYRGSEVLREISWVIYDEIHYMRDKERGVVWEETLILLPPSVHFVFLSATIPNAKQFAQWICRLHKQPCHVVYTDYRPTPLQHYVFAAKSSGLHLVVDAQGVFRDASFQAAMSTLASDDDPTPANKRKRTKSSDNTDIFRVVKLIIKKSYHPVIVFVFSRLDCEYIARDLSKLDFNTSEEKELCEKIYTNAINQLDENDQNLEVITKLLPILQKGIAFHHSGLLPIIKEVVEILFQENLIKVLIATETFSIGINMPAKTVVFSEIEKFDGKEVRHLTGGEYIQMSGRAGRRGLDDMGIVVMMVNAKIDSEKAKGMVKGESDPLFSAFRLGYNMILNMIRVEGATPEYLIQNSFRQFQNNSKLPAMLDELACLEQEYAGIIVDKEPQVRSYFELKYSLCNFMRDYCAVVTHPNYSLPFLKAGRLVEIMHNNVNFGWGVLLKFCRRSTNNTSLRDSAESYLVDVAIVIDSTCLKGNCKNDTALRIEDLRPPTKHLKSTRKLVVVPVLLSCLTSISSHKMNLFENNDLRSEGSRKKFLEIRDTIIDRLINTQGCVPVLDPIKDMKITDKKFLKLQEKIKKYTELVENHPLANSKDLEDALPVYEAKLAMSERIKSMRRSVAGVEAVLQLEELKSRKRVLKRLGFINESDVVEIKGRVACELSAADPLVLTELLFSGTFRDLSIPVTTALMGVFVFNEKPKGKGPKKQMQEEGSVKLSNDLEKPFVELVEIAKRIAAVNKDAGVEFDEKAFFDALVKDHMPIVKAWSSGESFVNICAATEMFEGNIIRNFHLLGELLKQMIAASKVMGNQDLEIKFSQCISSIKRGIVIAPSLYL